MAERKRFLLRIDPRLWDKIRGMAAREFRSVNGRIEYLLEIAVRERLGTTEGRTFDRGPPPSESGGPPRT